MTGDGPAKTELTIHYCFRFNPNFYMPAHNAGMATDLRFSSFVLN